MEFMSLEEEEERWGLLFLLPHEKYRGCLSARRWVLNRLSACSPSQPLELWEINVCCLKCFICVFDAFVKAFRIEDDTGWEIAFRKGVKLCLEKRQLQTHQAVWHVSSAGPRSGLCLVPQAQAFSLLVVLLHTMYGKEGIYWHNTREIRPGLME